MKSPVILRIFKNGQLKEVKQFDQDQIVIGHNADVHLDLDGDGISAIHCLIELREGGYYLCDLGSQTGTFKNGQAILDEAIVTGDEVVVGSFKLQFFVGVPKPKSTPALASAPALAPVEASAVAPIAASVASAPATVATPAPVIPAASAAVVPAASAAVISKPEIRSNKSPSSATRRKKKRPTFAPVSEVSDLREFIKPGKGPYVEVLTCWKERVLESHIVKKKLVVKHVDGGEIPLPADYAPKGWPLLDTTSGVRIMLTDEMRFDVLTANGLLSAESYGSRVSKSGAGTIVRLEQNEAIFVTHKNSDLGLIFRYAPQTGAIVMEPPLMLSSAELTALVLAIVMAGLFKFYIDSVTPVDWGVENQEEVERIAEVVFNPPQQKVAPPPPPAEPDEVKPPPPPPPPPPVEQKAKVADKQQNNIKKGQQNQAEQAQKAQTAGRAAEVAPKPNSKNKPKQFTSTRQGGAVKTTDKAGANAQSANKDVSKIGMLSTFGGGGNRAKLDQAYSGAGDLLGMADKATGSSGFAEDRAGDDLGSKFKDTGAGGKGTATQGIAGVGTKGRGSGMSAYGSASGFGNKTTVTVESGGAEEDFVGTIDREAIRRVVRAKLHEVKSCYERVLNQQAKGTKLEGKVVISWEIIAKGQVRNAKVKSTTLGNSTVENCIRDRLSSWVFPEPPEGMTAEVAYPFLLNQNN